MSEPSSGAASAGGTSAGAQLRAAREKQGLHVAALAAMIKIPQRKLEALEGDRIDLLPDATFARALALTVCRALRIDAAPVLAQLPQAGATGLADASGGLNAPFRDRPGRAEPAELGLARHPLLWAALLVLVAAAMLFLLPAGWWQSIMPGDSAAGAASGAVPGVAPASAAAWAAPPAATAAPVLQEAAPSAAPAAQVEVVHSVPSAESSASAVADVAAGVAVLRAAEASWVEVTDAGGQLLVQRVLQPGESLGLDGRLPLKLKIGNAAATQLTFRGQGVDLAPATRDNVARLELK
ncbi:MAG TPA: helix-turn-helix domain-containing protein [Rubrivivax sp.]|jgi:cytoskeleton protein RodZ|nr:helix-turn-helix domain-containing protein [Rubrivivax sp.]